MLVWLLVNSAAILTIEKPRYLGNSITDRRKIWHDMLVKFGTLRDLVISVLIITALSNCNRKMIRNVNGHHLENYNDVIHTPPIIRDSHGIWCSDAK